ncbi:superoxide dismutase [Ni] [Desulfopila sp. IMCC35008]|uniref:superoxide dismutase [Ni] n=1 Tax=Desulfopila sp. IMCC35008 TaxID=2653858 RepID=UPI0013D5986F|nr:superoxide dismutase [Ni] [Desulfopila sp. IMCC35008]
MKKIVSGIAILACYLIVTSTAFAHCEIPCGIYDDKMRITMIAEHVTTIEKSMSKIMEIEKAGGNSNQLVRWVMNKEEHASQLQEIVTQYFMTQRIKTNTDKYPEKLSLLHQMLLVSMQAKQTTDLEKVTELRSLLADFEKLYFAPH